MHGVWRMTSACSRLRKLAFGIALAWCIGSGAAFSYERPDFQPGFNFFSRQQDVEVGRKAAAQMDRTLPLVRDPVVVSYVNHLGKYLAQYAPNQKGFRYDWTFQVVNSDQINAFALPGGYIFVNRGAIEAAQDEAQIAGVLAHEEGHVVMRHGTHQASEKLLADAPLEILAGYLGQSGSLLDVLAQMGIGFSVNSFFLKNSRDMEAQADRVGTYILYQSGYDPYAMAQFFQIIQKKYPQQTAQFFSDHPNPGNRIEAVDREVPELGPPKSWKTDSPEFEIIKKLLLAMPPPPKAGTALTLKRPAQGTAGYPEEKDFNVFGKEARR